MSRPDPSHNLPTRSCPPRAARIAILAIGGLAAAAHGAEPLCPPGYSGPSPSSEAATDAPDAGPGRVGISSDTATLGADGDATLEGNVRVRQGERELRAEQVEYDAGDNAFQVHGNVEYVDPLLRVRGTSGHYSASGGAGFESAEFELRERAARGSAKSLELDTEGVVRLESVSFTTCPVTDPAWSLRARGITLDTRRRLGSGRDARIDFKGVPLLYVPWVSFPLGDERKSGFLFPSVGHTSRSGVQLAVPYYWNIAPNADLTFEPVLYGSRGIDLSGEVRYLSPRHRGELSFNYLPEDRVANRYRGLVSLDHRTELPRDFRFVIDAASASDTRYFEDFGQGPEGTSTAFLERFAQVSYRDETWRFSAELQQFQTIDAGLQETDRPYARVPRFFSGGDFAWGELGIVRYGYDSELVNFQRSVGVTGWRFDARPGVRLELDGPGYFVRPALAWRFTQYALDDVEAAQQRSPTRTLPIASFDTGLVFERTAGPQGTRTVTLEPRMLYLYVPFRDQDELPLFDTTLPDLNLPQLFRTNRYVGGDRVSDANEVSLGLTSRLIDADSGRQYLAATIGQAFYFDTPDVRIPGEVVESRYSSDFVAQLALTAYENWNADFGLQWNPESSRNERAQVNLQYRPSSERVINAGYRFQRDRPGQAEGIEQTDLSVAWPVNQRWHAFGRFVYSMRDDKALERFAGFEYRACCWRLRMLGRRFVSSRTGEQDTGVYLQLELTGLAGVGSAADAFLEGAIRGYSRPEPSL